MSWRSCATGLDTELRNAGVGGMARTEVAETGGIVTSVGGRADGAFSGADLGHDAAVGVRVWRMEDCDGSWNCVEGLAMGNLADCEPCKTGLESTNGSVYFRACPGPLMKMFPSSSICALRGVMSKAGEIDPVDA